MYWKRPSRLSATIATTMRAGQRHRDHDAADDQVVRVAPVRHPRLVEVADEERRVRQRRRAQPRHAARQHADQHQPDRARPEQVAGHHAPDEIRIAAGGCRRIRPTASRPASAQHSIRRRLSEHAADHPDARRELVGRRTRRSASPMRRRRSTRGWPATIADDGVPGVVAQRAPTRTAGTCARERAAWRPARPPMWDSPTGYEQHREDDDQQRPESRRSGPPRWKPPSIV